MTTATRRTFIKLMAISSGALVLGVRIANADEEPGEFAPNVWLRIERDGSIVIQVGKSEMGQGVRTSLPMILAEELDADFADVRIEQASPSSDFTSLGTGGSGSIMRTWDPLREAGAAARTMLVAAAASRWAVPADSCKTEKSHVVHKTSGKRLPYRELVAAAANQPVPESPKLKSPKEFTLLGTEQHRLDGPDIVCGKATYGIDVRLPGMLYAVVARPPVLGSEVKSFDATAAKKVRGVREVAQIPSGISVIAENTWAALKGREALKIEWTESKDASFDSDKHLEDLADATKKPGVTIRKDGVGREGFAKATKKIEAAYYYPFAAHAAVEPVNCTVLLEDGRCEIWSPTQNPNGVHRMSAAVLELPPESVKVNVQLLGGGFGRRLNIDFDWEAVNIAKAMKGTPIQLMWTREDDMKHGHFQAASVHRMFAGFDDDYNLVAWEHRKATAPHNGRPISDEAKQDPDTVRGWAWGVYDNPYAYQAAEMTYTAFDVPMGIGPWRAVFSPSSVFARECFVDEIAEMSSRNPIELRLHMLGADDETVPKSFEMEGDLVERDRMARVMEVVRDKSRFGTELPKGHAWGVAGNVFHTGTYVAYAVEVSLEKSGDLPFTVHKVICAIDCGIVINPDGVRQQVESGVIWSLANMKNQITFKNGSAVEGNYDDFPVVMVNEVPPIIETHIVEWDAERPVGIGEPVVCPFAPAVANALSRLTGTRVRKLPVRAEDLTS